MSVRVALRVDVNVAMNHQQDVVNAASNIIALIVSVIYLLIGLICVLDHLNFSVQRNIRR